MNGETSEVETLRAEMKAEFQRVFVQTQGGFEESHRFAMFLDERLRKEMTQGFSRVERRFEAVDARFDRVDKRFDEVIRLIKER